MRKIYQGRGFGGEDLSTDFKDNVEIATPAEAGFMGKI